MRFIYVADDSARDKLLAAGYELLNSDEQKQSYIFINNLEGTHETFSLLEVRCALLDTLVL